MDKATYYICKHVAKIVCNEAIIATDHTEINTNIHLVKLEQLAKATQSSTNSRDLKI